MFSIQRSSAFAIAAFLVLALSACATGYKSWNGNFIATPKADGTHDILVRATVMTSTDLVDKFALVFAAETTLENGGRYFEVNRARGGTVNNGYEVYRKVEMNISVLEDEPEAAAGKRQFEAEEIITRLGPEVKG